MLYIMEWLRFVHHYENYEARNSRFTFATTQLQSTVHYTAPVTQTHEEGLQYTALAIKLAGRILSGLMKFITWHNT